MPDKDSRYRFLLENANVRGVLVRLDETWKEVLRRAEYPARVQQVLGHAMAAMPLLASTIKFSGKLTLQARGTGPVNLLVVQASADGGQRGLAHWKSEPPESPLKEIFGDASLTIQIESGKRGEVYQGVVDAVGEKLQDALGHYFENSEQLPTQLWLYSDTEKAAGVLLQQLPDDKDIQDDKKADDWHRITLMANTVTAKELYDSEVADLLTRVFSEDEVRLFEAEPLRFECNCSRARTAALIEGIGQEEALDILAQEGEIEITCEFCNSKNVFDSIDVEAIFRSDTHDGESTVIH